MEKIIENMFNMMTERMDRIESRLSDLETNKDRKSVYRINPNKPASERQIVTLESMGYECWPGMTNQDVSRAFEELNKKRAKFKQEIPQNQEIYSKGAKSITNQIFNQNKPSQAELDQIESEGGLI